MPNYYDMFMDAAGMFLFLGTELSVLFILICAGVSLLQQYIPDSKIQKLLGGTHGRGYVLAALLGAVTPFCSCSTIPMLRGLLKAKAGFGPTLTFLFASPLLNPIIIALFVATFGLKVSITYTSVALFVSIVGGLILSRMKFDRYIIPESHAPVASTSCCDQGTGPAKTSCCTEIKPLQSSCCATPNTLQPLEPLKTSCCSEPTTLQPFEPLQSSCCSEQKTLEPLQSPCCPAPNTLQPLEPMQSACCSNEQENTSSCCSTGSAKASLSSCCDTSTVENSSSCCDTGCNTQSYIGLSFGQRIKLAFIDAWGQFKQVFPYLLLGVVLGALVYGFVPSDFIAKYAGGDSIFAVPIAAVIGIPLYVRVEALIALSAVLVGKGMGLGAVMALIIGGGGASLTEVILLKSMFRTPMIIAFLVVILGMAVSAGYIFQYLI